MTSHVARIWADFQDKGARPGEDVGLLSSEGAVEYISFDDAAVFKRLSRFALEMAASPEEPTELLERSVNCSPFRASRAMRLPEMNDPCRSELGNVGGEVNAQSGDLTLKSGRKNTGHQGECVGDEVLDIVSTFVPTELIEGVDRV